MLPMLRLRARLYCFADGMAQSAYVRVNGFLAPPRASSCRRDRRPDEIIKRER